ncbi:glucose-methanol-choline oxidoreductase [Ophiocordyceps sinensis CO18]|uniref:Glucose-methanol-choline oxidoreductase n=1 Tax=Ophiocordyceps sinensis (strain Co18 / CGMCC 3.14243) TaxID=911162 RepID=T5A712_OPHSC|nr:glucose-methanol-choline oxidoreductase [Ophiocordyceps sinensis CO18]
MVPDGARFDFVVVGGGTAGNTVAGRLAETAGVSVLIVEAGAGNPQDVAEIMTPSSAMDLRGSQYDWAYKSTIVRRDDYERIEKPNTRGKVLGGSSALNYFTWVPGCRATFDGWREFAGDEWTWERLLPYLRKSATYHDDDGLFSPDLAKVGAGAGPVHWHYPVPRGGSYTTVVVDLVRPVSAPGTVTLRSADAREQPDINLNFFADDLDIVAMREGIRFSYDVLTKGDGFCDVVEAEYPWDMALDSDADMKRAVLDRCQTAFHPCGTARLSRSVEQGVVDARLRVHGVAGLRVVDASVIPVIPDCRIQNSVYMVGEKAADMIKEDFPVLFG